MARVTPHLSAQIYPIGAPPYATVYHGFGREDAIRELYDRRDDIGASGQLAENKPGSQILRISKVALDDTVAWPYGGLKPNENPEAAVYIPHPFGQLIPAPMWDTTQTIDLNYWQPIGSWTDANGVNNHWNDQMLLPGLPQPVLIMTNGTPMATTGLRSRFNVPWNAVMCFALWRAEPPEDAVDYSFSVTRDAADDWNLNSSIWTRRADLPEAGTAATVVDDEGTEYEVTISDIVGGVYPGDPTGDPPTGYPLGANIFVAPPLAVGRTITTLTVQRTWTPPSNYRYGTSFEFGITGTRAFRLELPYGSEAVMWMRDATYTGNQWKQLRPERSARLRVGDIYNQQIKAGKDVTYNYVWVARTATGVAVSTDGFVSNVGFWSTQVESPSMDKPYGVVLNVPRGPVEFTHNAGAWGMAWLPINHPASMTIDGPVTRLPYDMDEYLEHTSVQHRLPPRLKAIGITSVNEDGEINNDTTVVRATNGEAYTRVPATGNGFEWRVTLSCDVQTDTFTAVGQISEQQKSPSTSSKTYSHAVVPELHAVRYWTWPGVKTTAAGTPTALEIVSGEVSRSMDDAGVVGSIVLEDVPTEDYPQGQQRAQFFTLYRPRLITLVGRWLDADGNVVEDTNSSLYTGMVGVPDSKGNGLYPTAQLQDEAVKAIEGVSDGRVPPFDSWPVRNAVMWILDHLGIRFDAEAIEDTGLCLTSALTGQDPLWYAEDGRRWRDLLDEMCLYDYMAHISIDSEGKAHKFCYYCGRPRSSDATSADWAPLHALHGWTGAACLAADVTTSGNEYGVDRFITLGAKYKVEVPTGTPEVLTHEGSEFHYWGHLIEEEYFNHCRVKGAKHMGVDDPMSVEFTYWPSVVGDGVSAYALGYRKSQNHTFEWATDYATLYRVGRCLHYKHLMAPVFCDVTIPFAPELSPRNTVALYGYELERKGMSGCRWRIIGLTHRMDRRLGVWRTELQCRYLGVVAT